MRISPKEKEHLFAELEKYMASGISLDQATRALLDHPNSNATEALLIDIKKGLKNHLTLTQAISQSTTKGITNLDTAILEAGEKGGRIPEAFNHLHHYYQLTTQTLSRIRSSLIYPAVLLHLGIILPTLPRLVSAPDKLKVIGQSLGLLFALYFLIAVIWISFRQLSETAKTSTTIDSLLSKIPLLGKFRKKFAIARFCCVLRMTLQSAMKPTQAIRAAGKASQSALLLTASETIRSSILKGTNLSTPMKEQPVFQKAFTRAIATAETTGTLDKEAERWQDIYQKEAQQSANAIAIWLPKIIYFAIVFFVAWQIISMYRSYMNGIMDILDAMP